MDLKSNEVAAQGLRRYVQLVSEAMGLSGACWYIEPEPPVSVYLPVEGRLPRFPTRDVALVWDEEHGWAVAIEASCGEDLIVVSSLGVEALPPPPVVARFVARVFDGDLPGRTDLPALRSAAAADDLPEQLAAYTRPAAPSGAP